MGTQLKATDAFGDPYCVLKIPHVDWVNFIDGKLDFTGNFYDCTKHEFNDFDNNHEILKKYIPDYNAGRYIAFPRFNEVKFVN